MRRNLQMRACPIMGLHKAVPSPEYAIHRKQGLQLFMCAHCSCCPFSFEVTVLHPCALQCSNSRQPNHATHAATPQEHGCHVCYVMLGLTCEHVEALTCCVRWRIMKASRPQPTCRVVPDTHVQTANRRRNFLFSSWVGACMLATGHLPQNAIGASPPGSQQDAPALYDAFAKDYDNLDDGAAASLFGFPDLRQRMLSAATGRVLECGSGTGAPHALLQTCFPKFGI